MARGGGVRPRPFQAIFKPTSFLNFAMKFHTSFSIYWPSGFLEKVNYLVKQSCDMAFFTSGAQKQSKMGVEIGMVPLATINCQFLPKSC